MFCSISGEVPTDPVVSKKSGHLYSRKIIEKYIAAEGRCPISGGDLTETDLISIQGNPAVRPRVSTSTSIPGLLAMFQNEWDEVVLESFTLKQHLNATRQELSQALYQHDAACRVIARLMRERDEARAMLESLSQQQHQQQQFIGGGSSNSSSSSSSSSTAAANSMEISGGGGGDEEGLGEEIVSVLNDKCKELAAERKGRKPSATLAPRESFASFSAPSSSSFTSHKSTPAGVTCVAVSPSSSSSSASSSTLADTICSGGMDKVAVIINRTNGQVVSKLVGHAKKITRVAYHPRGEETLFTSSADGQVKVWSSTEKGDYSEACSFAGSGGAEVADISIHPTGNYILKVESGGSWSFLDVKRGATVVSISSSQVPLRCGQLHPDGLIFATGSAPSSSSGGELKIWDIRDQKNVASISEHSGAIHALSFSENGYTLATGGDNGVVKIWDLRKITCVKTIEVGAASVSSVAFDYSGQYLAIGAGQQIEVQVAKEWTPLASLAVHSKAVTGLAWGSDARFLVSSSMDRTVKVIA